MLQESFQTHENVQTWHCPSRRGSGSASASLSSACVADRPSRNGVFNENQYLRKDFLIQGTDTNGNGQGQDPGWMVRATVTETSSPNLLGSAAGADIFAGEMTGVR